MINFTVAKVLCLEDVNEKSVVMVTLLNLTQ